MIQDPQCHGCYERGHAEHHGCAHHRVLPLSKGKSKGQEQRPLKYQKASCPVYPGGVEVLTTIPDMEVLLRDLKNSEEILPVLVKLPPHQP